MKIWVIIKTIWNHELGLSESEEVQGAVTSREALITFFNRLKEKDENLVQYQPVPFNTHYLHTIPILESRDDTVMNVCVLILKKCLRKFKIIQIIQIHLF
jgi:hypothetical protein